MRRRRLPRKFDRQERKSDAVELSRNKVYSLDGKSDTGLGLRHLFLCTFVLSVYVYTALPSVPGGDAGELLAEGCQFGIPHPPGYPLLTILHFVIGSVPISSVSPPAGCAISTPSTVARAANIMSCIFGSATATLVALTVEEWTRGSNGVHNPGAAAAGALLFSLSPLTWEYSTAAEVFALNNFLVALALYLTARIIRRPSMVTTRVGAVVCGLALSNQHASALTLGPLALSVAWSLAKESLLTLSCFFELVAVWFPLGLSPYAVLLLSAQKPRQGSWGDTSSLVGFLRHILRLEYGTLRLGISVPNSESAFERIREYLADSSSQTLHIGPPVALLGVVWACTAHRNTHPDVVRQDVHKVYACGIGLVVAWAFYVILWHCVLSNISLRHPMSRAVHARFWMQPNLLLCVAAGAGFGIILCAATGALRRMCPSFHRVRERAVPAAVSLLLPVLLAVGMTWARFEAMDRGAWSYRSSGWTMHLYGQAMLASLPERAVLLSHTDLDLNAARYLRVCEALRPDVTHVSLQMMPYRWWNASQAKLHAGIVFPPILRGVSTKRDSEGNAVLITRFLAANMPLGRPIFLDMQAVDEREIGAAGVYRGFSLVPHGLTYRVLPKLTLRDTERWHNGIVKQLRSLDDCMRPVSTIPQAPGSWEFAAKSVYWDAHYQAGLFFLSYGVGVWANTPGAQQRAHVLPALKDASTLLKHTLEAVDSHGTFSSPRADLLKNTMLAQVRLLQALQAAVVSASTVEIHTRSEKIRSSAVLEKLAVDIVVIREQCLTLISRFLLEAADDKDAEAFGKMYMKLREA